MASIGKAMIKIKPKKFKVGDVISVLYKVIHPMETGMAKDKETKKIIPAHYITDISCQFEGKEFSKMKVWESVSTDPSFKFKYRVTGAGELKIEATDNLGKKFVKTKKLKPKA